MTGDAGELDEDVYRALDVVAHVLPAELGARLQGQQARILKEAAILRATGNGLNPAERFYLRARQAGASANIFIKKHN